MPNGQRREHAEATAVYLEGRIHDQVWSPLHMNSSSLGGHKACTGHKQIWGIWLSGSTPLYYAPYGTFALPLYHCKELSKQSCFRDSVSLTHIIYVRLSPPCSPQPGTVLFSWHMTVGERLALPVQGSPSPPDKLTEATACFPSRRSLRSSSETAGPATSPTTVLCGERRMPIRTNASCLEDAPAQDGAHMVTGCPWS